MPNTPENRALEYLRQKLTGMQGEIDDSTVAARDF